MPLLHRSMGKASITVTTGNVKGESYHLIQQLPTKFWTFLAPFLAQYFGFEAHKLSLSSTKWTKCKVAKLATNRKKGEHLNTKDCKIFCDSWPK